MLCEWPNLAILYASPYGCFVNWVFERLEPIDFQNEIRVIKTAFENGSEESNEVCLHMSE